jgi:hypothetical protein
MRRPVPRWPAADQMVAVDAAVALRPDLFRLSPHGRLGMAGDEGTGGIFGLATDQEFALLASWGRR